MNGNDDEQLQTDDGSITPTPQDFYPTQNAAEIQNHPVLESLLECADAFSEILCDQTITESFLKELDDQYDRLKIWARDTFLFEEAHSVLTLLLLDARKSILSLQIPCDNADAAELLSHNLRALKTQIDLLRPSNAIFARFPREEDQVLDVGNELEENVDYDSETSLEQDSFGGTIVVEDTDMIDPRLRDIHQSIKQLLRFSTLAKSINGSSLRSNTKRKKPDHSISTAVPSENHPSVHFALYDRRALYSTSGLLLVNSLTSLSYLTTISQSLRGIITRDGGIERLIEILREAPHNIIDESKYDLAFQCIANTGIRGSEAVRTKVVEAGAVPMIAAVLDGRFQNLEELHAKSKSESKSESKSKSEVIYAWKLQADNSVGMRNSVMIGMDEPRPSDSSEYNSLIEDIKAMTCLQLLACLSENVILRPWFRETRLEPFGTDDSAKFPLDGTNRSSTPDDTITIDDKSPHFINYDVFQLVEKFTTRQFHPLIQYWARVIIRNISRKDNSRGGIRQCSNPKCGKWEEISCQFPKCRRCRRTKYCSKECQKAAWPNHRYWCAETKS